MGRTDSLDLELLLKSKLPWSPPSGAFSPDGKVFVFSVERSACERIDGTCRTSGYNEDIFVVDVDSAPGEARYLCAPSGDGVRPASWRPRWSPSGKFLSFFIEDGQAARLAVWSVAARRIIGQWNVADPAHPYHSIYEWSSSDLLVIKQDLAHRQSLTFGLNAGRRKDVQRDYLRQTPHAASATVLQTANPGASAADLVPAMAQCLAVYRLPDGAQMCVGAEAHTPVCRIEVEENTYQFELSADRSAICFLQKTGLHGRLCQGIEVSAPADDHHSRSSDAATPAWLFVLSLGDALNSGPAVKALCLGRYAMVPDSLALFGPGNCFAACLAILPECPHRMAVLSADLASSTITVHRECEFRAWSRNTIGKRVTATSHKLLFPATLEKMVSESGGAPGDSWHGREDWWIFDPAGKPSLVCTSQTLPHVPASLVETGAGTFWGVGGSTLYELNSRTPVFTAASAWHGWRIEDILSPKADRSGDRIVPLPWQAGSAQVALLGNNAAEAGCWLVTPSAGQQAKFENAGDTVGIASSRRCCAYVRYAEHATEVRIAAHAGRKTLAQFNQHLANVAKPKVAYFPVEGRAGTICHSRAVLPPRFARDRSFPVIVSAYPGSQYFPGRKPVMREMLQPSPFNPFLYAAQGYVVLQPGLPLDNVAATDILSAAGENIDAVLAHAVDRGFGDANRLFIMGHSWGAELVMDVISRSGKFKAAAAMAGTYDHVSAYGAFFGSAGLPLGTVSYGTIAEHLIAAGWRGNFAGAPWEEPDAYQQASAIYKAAAIDTPVLLFHGEDDAIPIQQAEEMFTALWQCRKIAKFVRYALEGHTIERAANLAHFMSTLTAWFAGFDPGHEEPGEE